MFRFEFDRNYTGDGVSKGLQRGLLAQWDGVSLTEEGMGLGACACRSGGRTYFASIQAVQTENGFITVHLSFDQILRQCYYGFEIEAFRRCRAYFVENIYMHNPSLQRPVLFLGSVARKLLRVTEDVVAIDSAGKAVVQYTLDRNDVYIEIKYSLQDQDAVLYVMNELGGQIFDLSLMGGSVLDPPSGWRELEGHPELYSSLHKIALSFTESDPCPASRRRLFWGREFKKGVYSWAGFEIEIRPAETVCDRYSYRIHFREVIG